MQLGKIYLYPIAILIIITIILTSRLQYYKNKHMAFVYISWIEYGGIDSQRWGSLFEYICEIQHELQIPSQYCILINDKENIQIILEKFQRDISWRYYAGNISLDKHKTKINCEDMFYALLHSYLLEHECDYSFENQIMHHQISKKSYGSWGAELYDSENILTDFGIAFEKLNYVISEQCYRNKDIQKAFGFHKCDGLKKNIDEKHISISRM